jgi:hypothetical protein
VQDKGEREHPRQAQGLAYTAEGLPRSQQARSLTASKTRKPRLKAPMRQKRKRRA